MALAEIWQRPIYGSERILSADQLQSRTLNMYELAVNNLFDGNKPKKMVKSIELKDSLGRKWELDLVPGSQSLYVRRYWGQGGTITQGFKTDPFRKKMKEDDEKYTIRYWKKNRNTGNSKDKEWMLQESEALLEELLTNSKTQLTSEESVDH